MLSLIALVLLPYLGFVFFGESLDPIHKPSSPFMRSRWRYGRRMATSVWVGVLSAVICLDYLGGSLVFATVTGIAVFSVPAIAFSAKGIVQGIQRR